MAAKERRQRVQDALERVGMGHREKHVPSQLSGGQQQLVGVARAIIASPKLVLADEPTGNLDPENARQVLELLRNQVKAHGAAGLLATHSREAAAKCDRAYVLSSSGLALL